MKKIKNVIADYKMQIIGAAAAIIGGGIALYCLDHSKIGYAINDHLIDKLAIHIAKTHKLRFYNVVMYGKDVPKETIEELLTTTTDILKKAGVIEV